MVRSTLLYRFFSGPFGQNFSFNANVEFSKICTPNESFMACIVKNGFQNQLLQYFMIQIDVFKVTFEIFCYSEKFVQSAAWCPKSHFFECMSDLAYFF